MSRRTGGATGRPTRRWCSRTGRISTSHEVCDNRQSTRVPVRSVENTPPGGETTFGREEYNLLVVNVAVDLVELGVELRATKFAGF